MDNFKVTVDEGLYTLEYVDGLLYVHHYHGDDYRYLCDDRLVFCLADALNKARSGTTYIIEAQKAELERQRVVLDSIYTAHGCSITTWCSTCGEDVHTIECQKCSEFWTTNDLEKSDMKEKIQHLTSCLAKANAQVKDLKSKLGSSSNLALTLLPEIDRLETLVETAFYEGLGHSFDLDHPDDVYWHASEAHAALYPEEDK